jgi:hypothetical protein
LKLVFLFVFKNVLCKYCAVKFFSLLYHCWYKKKALISFYTKRKTKWSRPPQNLLRLFVWHKKSCKSTLRNIFVNLYNWKNGNKEKIAIFLGVDGLSNESTLSLVARAFRKASTVLESSELRFSLFDTRQGFFPILFNLVVGTN